jgi:hypothetical protein
MCSPGTNVQAGVDKSRLMWQYRMLNRKGIRHNQGGDGVGALNRRPPLP